MEKTAQGKGKEFLLLRLAPTLVTINALLPYRGQNCPKKGNSCIESEQCPLLSTGKRLIVRYWHFGMPLATFILLYINTFNWLTHA